MELDESVMKFVLHVYLDGDLVLLGSDIYLDLVLVEEELNEVEEVMLVVGVDHLVDELSCVFGLTRECVEVDVECEWL